jgi:hypothetical protein
MPNGPTRSALAFLLLTVSGCKACSRSTAPDAGPAPAPSPVTSADFPPSPSEWRFRAARGIQEIALPSGCSNRAPIVSALVGPPVRFLAEPHTLGALIVGEASGTPIRLTAAGIITLDPEGVSHDPVRVPWLVAGALPRFARAQTTWVAGVDRGPSVTGGPTRLAVWRGDVTEDLGEGDEFETIDMACGDDRCALLTSRPTAVHKPGAQIWFGRPNETVSAWKSVALEPTRQGDLSDAHGVGIARAFARSDAKADAGVASPPVVAAVSEIGEVVFLGVSDAGAVDELARLPTPNGVIDAIALPTPMALVYASAIDDEGCAPEGGKLELVRAGLPSVPLQAPTPPNLGSIRRLAKGYFASWMAPLRCHEPRRVVFGVVLDESGKPISEVMAIGDAAAPAGSKLPPTYAVASSGADVDLWIQNEGSVTWIRARCSPP